jgi:type IV pilus assembly protein PilE
VKAARAAAAGHTPRRRGFTLVEVAATTAVAAALAAAALPALHSPLAKSRRADAVQALLQIQAAQARHHADSGLYALDLGGLPGTGRRSEQGWYELSMEVQGPEHWRAVARARADGPQASDRDCQVLTLEAREGFVTQGPSPRCWNL